MPNGISTKKSTYAPLEAALKGVEFWLERNGVPRVIVATPTLQELRRRNRREHLNVTPRKMRGPRQPVRGRRHYHEPHTRLALWPRDNMDENVLPFMAYVISGRADFRIANYVLHCEMGDWVCVPGGIPKQDGTMPHFEGDSAGRQCDVLWINTIYMGVGKERGVQSWICHSKGEQHFREKGMNCCVGSRFLAQLFNGLCDEIQTRNAPEVVTPLLRGVLSLMRTEIAENNVLFGGSNEIAELETSRDPIEEAKAYIAANMWRRLTIQNVARQVLVSPSTLTRYFRERTGQTFIEHLNEQRVQLASELLRETDLPISNIGEKVGLKYGQLRVLIQKHFQCTPGELRARKSETE